LWEICAHNNDGIIARSTLKKLYDLFDNNSSDYGNFFLGKVDYWRKDNIITYFEDEKIVEEILSLDG